MALEASGPGSRYGAQSLMLAAAIEGDIVARGWPVGEVLGSEEELMARYDVSRAVLRQAVRLMRSRGVAKARPGPGGGLVVTKPDPAGMRHIARLHLDYAKVTASDLYEAFLALQLVAVGRLATDMSTTKIVELRALVAEQARRGVTILDAENNIVQKGIARMAGNPAIELFVEVLTELANARRAESSDRERAAQWLQAQDTAIVEAIVAGDTALAQHLTRRMFDRLEQMGAVTPLPEPR